MCIQPGSVGGSTLHNGPERPVGIHCPLQQIARGNYNNVAECIYLKTKRSHFFFFQRANTVFKESRTARLCTEP